MKIKFIIIFIFISLIGNILSDTIYTKYPTHLKKGGKLVYSTCTVFERENHEQSKGKKESDLLDEPEEVIETDLEFLNQDLFEGIEEFEQF
jgi:hypothetical protein